MQHPKAGQNTQHVLINIERKKYQFAVNQRLAVSDPNFFYQNGPFCLGLKDNQLSQD